MADIDALQLVDLRVWFGTDGDPVRAVDGVTLTIAAGEAVALVGESGCGKSTLARAIPGALPQNAALDGRVLLRGQDVHGLDAPNLQRLRGRRVGIVFQDPLARLDPLMSIGRHMQEAIEVLSGERPRAAALDALERVGISPDLCERYPHELSGGMRQRVLIGLALAAAPDLLIADEPTASLDAVGEAELLAMLDRERRRNAGALLLITHDLAVAARACERIVVMYAGRIVEDGPSETVLAAPAHPYTRALVRARIGPATRSLHPIAGEPPDLRRPPSGCRFHPRCPEVMARCRELDPLEITVGERRSAACWLHDPGEEDPDR